MPLKKGKSQKAFQVNIKELMHKWKRTGKIGTSSPKTSEEARRQAVAIAFATRRGK